VRLARGRDRAIPALAADPGVSSEARRHRLRQADADAGRGPPGDLTTDVVLPAPLAPGEPRPHAGARAPEKSRGLLRAGDRVRRHRFIRGAQAASPIMRPCRVPDVARAAYDAWARRGVAARAQADAHRAARIAAAHARVRAALRACCARAASSAATGTAGRARPSPRRLTRPPRA